MGMGWKGWEVPTKVAFNLDSMPITGVERSNFDCVQVQSLIVVEANMSLIKKIFERF